MVLFNVRVFLVFAEADMKLPCVFPLLFNSEKNVKSLKIKFGDISLFQKLMIHREQDKKVDY